MGDVVAGAPASPPPLQLVSTFGTGIEEPIAETATDAAVAGLSQVPLDATL